MTPSDDGPMVVVRQLGSGRCHVSRLDPADLFRGYVDPVITVCGVRLRKTRGPVVAMRYGTKVNCRSCARLSGVTEAQG